MVRLKAVTYAKISFWGEIFAYKSVFVCLWGFLVVVVFFLNSTLEVIPSSWMVYAGCVFVAGIH